ncbi:hypothetical protein ACEWY4_011252 [Coilia grayii]|uniref:Reverse transcriptase/retrotransposon-derived protein RNase H-like domain-containing protein n=1 Tax=Coilia grayii TaxID=363190 RepID=A0ABD1K479_9TELE
MGTMVDKVAAIRSCPLPNTKKGIPSVLGLVGWYCQFTPGFSSRAAVLTDLTRKNSPNKVRWTEACGQASEELKEGMCQGQVLQSPDFDLPFIGQTASRMGLGTVLLQGEGENPLDTLKYYLVGKDLNIETDHRALQWLHRMRDSNARGTLWYLARQPYLFTVKYCSGRTNVIADFLS